MNLPSIRAETEARLARIASEDPSLRAFIRVDAEDALSSASAADDRRVGGQTLSPLDGVTVAIKDNLAMAGKPWTAGIRGRRGLFAGADADAVARLRAAGAILIGGANMEEAALGAVTDNPTFGRCINPLGPGLTPGGSSGGSAATVAAGFVDLALGTDTMGSVRVPAAYCGIAGIKPTYGAISQDGLAMLCPSLDTIGPIARDVELLWPALKIMATTEARDRWLEPVGSDELSGVTFGVPKQLRTVDCEEAIDAGLLQAVEAVKSLGGTVAEIDLEGWDPQRSRRAGLLVTEAEGARELASLMDEPDAISDHLRSLLIYGRDAPAEKLATAHATIAAAAQAVDQAFVDVDAILLPTAPQRAFPHGRTPPSNQADLTALANFGGCPAVALPVGLAGETLSGSIQIIGPRWSDPAVLAWAGALAPQLT
ncbi:MAG: amidase [Pseudomonadota bacterium]